MYIYTHTYIHVQSTFISSTFYQQTAERIEVIQVEVSLEVCNPIISQYHTG